MVGGELIDKFSTKKKKEKKRKNKKNTAPGIKKSLKISTTFPVG